MVELFFALPRQGADVEIKDDETRVSQQDATK